MADVNRMVTLARRPVGMAVRDDFRIEEARLPEPGEDQFRVRISHVSLDPAMRGWISEGRSYVPPVALGGVMRAFAAGHVDRSNHPDFEAGDAVTGLFGAQHYVDRLKGIEYK